MCSERWKAHGGVSYMRVHLGEWNRDGRALGEVRLTELSDQDVKQV